MSSLLRLDLPSPEVFEERRIVATVSGLETVTITVSLPRAAGEAAGERDLLADAAYGGILIRRERPSDSQFRFVVALPRSLAHGDVHELALRLRLPPGQRMAAHYGFTPIVRCDEFRLRARFPTTAPPREVWLLDGVPPRTLDDEPAGLSPVVLDRAGEAKVHFTRLVLGCSYGLRWRDQPETGRGVNRD
jgi:hypothetical protein